MRNKCVFAVLGAFMLSLLMGMAVLGNTGLNAEPGWQKSGDLWYYKDSAGIMQTGWIYDEGSWYYLDETGYMRVGWVNADGCWYYLNEGGRMTTVNRYWGDLIYKFASSGELLSVSVDKKIDDAVFDAFMLSAMEQDMLNSINEERAEYQKNPLVLDMALNRLAAERLTGALDYGYSEREQTVEGQGTLAAYMSSKGYTNKGAVEIYIIDVETGGELEQFQEEGVYSKVFNYDKVGISIQERNSRQYLMLIFMN